MIKFSKVTFLVAICLFLGISMANAGPKGLLPLPKDCPIEMFSKCAINEGYDFSFDRQATNLITDIITYKCFSIDFGKDLLGYRWIFGASLNLAEFDDYINGLTGWKLNFTPIPILETIQPVFTISICPDSNYNEGKVTSLQICGSWKFADFKTE